MVLQQKDLKRVHNNRNYNIWLISDTHFGHSNVCKFTRNDGSPLRPWDDVLEMDEALIDNWNSVVKDNDLIIHAGDVCFSGQRYDVIMPRLKGRKHLIRGNHDLFSEGRYQRHFQKVLGIKILDNYAITHVPIHPESLARWKGNIHGHLHSNNVMKPGESYDMGDCSTITITDKDPRYFNVSVEQINYTPINFEEVKKGLDK